MSGKVFPWLFEELPIVRRGKAIVNNLRRQADRLELAEISDDPDILNKLYKDKSNDVRRAVARRDALSFEQLRALYYDVESSVSATALSTMAKAPMNEIQNAEYQNILREIALDAEADSSLLREVIYNLQDHSVLSTLYFRSNDSHIKAGIVRHIQSPEVLDVEIADIICRKAGERRVDNILCNPTLTKEQVKSLVSARKLNPVDMICKVESAQALIGLALLGNPTDVTGEYRVIADLRVDELEELLAIDERYAAVVHDQLHKLGSARCKELYTRNNMMYGWWPIAV